MELKVELLPTQFSVLTEQNNQISLFKEEINKIQYTQSRTIEMIAEFNGVKNVERVEFDKDNKQIIFVIKED